MITSSIVLRALFGSRARIGIVRMPMALDVRTKGRYLRMCLPIGTMAAN